MSTKRYGGCKTLADILDRCRVDTETGCWLWAQCVLSKRGTTTPVAHLGAGALGSTGKGNSMTAAKAAWLLAGKPLEPGHVVWRHVCRAGLCVNPAHCRAGTRSEMHATVAATGRNKGTPGRAAINTINRQSMLTPIDKVRIAESMFDAGSLQKDVQAALGITQKTAAAIRLGRHPHSVGRQRLVANASVFAWRPAA